MGKSRNVSSLTVPGREIKTESLHFETSPMISIASILVSVLLPLG